MNGKFLFSFSDPQESLPYLICTSCGDELYALDRVYVFEGEPVCSRCMYYRTQEGLRPFYAKDYIETGGYWDDDEANFG